MRSGAKREEGLGTKRGMARMIVRNEAPENRAGARPGRTVD